MNASTTGTVVVTTNNCEIVLDRAGFYVRCFARNCGYVSEITHAKHVARQWAGAHDATESNVTSPADTPDDGLAELNGIDQPPSPQADVLRQLMDAVEELGMFGGSFEPTHSGVTDGHSASVTIADDLGGRFYITCTSA